MIFLDDELANAMHALNRAADAIPPDLLARLPSIRDEVAALRIFINPHLEGQL